MCASARLAGESRALLDGGLFVAGAIRVGAVAEAAALAESATAGEVGGGGGLPGGMLLLSPAPADDREWVASWGGAPG